jgi:nucleoid DNA-binding protein
MVLTRTTLGEVLEGTLFLSSGRAQRMGPAAKIVNAFIQTLTTALQAGKTIRVRGIGTFKQRVKPSQRKSSFFYKGGPNVPFTTRERVVITFIPSPQLIRSLNEPYES